MKPNINQIYNIQIRHDLKHCKFKEIIIHNNIFLDI